MIIIDATDLVLGRLASHVAKQALLGETIHVVNSENTVITGTKKDVQAHYKQKIDRGTPQYGPFISKQEDKFVKRTIRGMLPYKQEKGRTAFERIKCHIGVPTELKDKKIETIEIANIRKMKSLKYIYLKDLVKILGKKP